MKWESRFQPLMQARDFVASIPGFDSLPPAEQIVCFAWYLHVYDGAERFDNEMIRECFRDSDTPAPDVSVYIPRLANRKPPVLLRDARGYRLSGTARRDLDEKHGQHPTTIAVTQLLAELPANLPDPAQREFLDEAYNCYRVKAFRAAIVMVWNLAYDHLERWIVGDAIRLTTFNDAIGKRFPRNVDRITALSDFEKFKEWEILAALRTAGLTQKNVVDILDEKLRRRNAAAHPSRITISQPQADVMIADLVNNVVLLLR